ncbi:SMN1 family protein [Megaselia abdita]
MTKKPSPDEDVWDDSELIEAWESQSKLQNSALARRLAEKTNTKKFNTPVNSVQEPIPSTSKGGTVQIYSVGDYCRATYEDGVDYEAKIVALSEGVATLKYIGYGNVSEVPIEDLVPSWGKKARKLQSVNAVAEKEVVKQPSKKTKSHISFSEATSNMSSLPVGFVPPPPPLPPMLNGEDNEHLSAMLMSWYMSGYYTGLYQGMNKGKNSSKSSKKK